MIEPRNLGEVLTKIVCSNIPVILSSIRFVSEEHGTYKITGWSGGQNIIQLTATYADGSERAIGADATKDRIATRQEARRYDEFR